MQIIEVKTIEFLNRITKYSLWLNIVYIAKIVISVLKVGLQAQKNMKNSDIEISVNVGSGNKHFTAYTMDLTKKYIEINADYRS